LLIACGRSIAACVKSKKKAETGDTVSAFFAAGC
jgi:hypothetical protein